MSCWFCFDHMQRRRRIALLREYHEAKAALQAARTGERRKTFAEIQSQLEFLDYIPVETADDVETVKVLRAKTGWNYQVEPLNQQALDATKAASFTIRETEPTKQAPPCTSST